MSDIHFIYIPLYILICKDLHQVVYKYMSPLNYLFFLACFNRYFYDDRCVFIDHLMISADWNVWWDVNKPNIKHSNIGLTINCCVGGSQNVPIIQKAYPCLERKLSGWCSSKPLDLYLGGNWFIPQIGHQLASWGFHGLPQGNAGIVSWLGHDHFQILSNSLFTNYPAICCYTVHDTNNATDSSLSFKYCQVWNSIERKKMDSIFKNQSHFLSAFQILSKILILSFSICHLYLSQSLNESIKNVPPNLKFTTTKPSNYFGGTIYSKDNPLFSLCRISCSHSSGYEEIYLLRYNAM
jgi:hypothetical protein